MPWNSQQFGPNNQNFESKQENGKNQGENFPEMITQKHLIPTVHSPD